MELPLRLGDRSIASPCAAAGPAVVADSTTVMISSCAPPSRRRGAGRRVAIGRPTSRRTASSSRASPPSAARPCRIGRPRRGDQDDVAAAIADRTALVLLSHVDYRSGAIADMAGITRRVQAAGALMMWDLCHSVGVLDVQLDACGVDLAVGCTYKYLNGGPGSPAFAYVSHGVQGRLRQPIWGWMGAADVFGMRQEYVPSPTIRQFISGTPPVVGMLAMQGMLDLVEQSHRPHPRQVGATRRVRRRGLRGAPRPLGVELVSPRRRGPRPRHDQPRASAR